MTKPKLFTQKRRQPVYRFSNRGQTKKRIDIKSAKYRRGLLSFTALGQCGSLHPGEEQIADGVGLMAHADDDHSANLFGRSRDDTRATAAAIKEEFEQSWSSLNTQLADVLNGNPAVPCVKGHCRCIQVSRTVLAIGKPNRMRGLCP
jgi:hypothetical protein